MSLDKNKKAICHTSTCRKIATPAAGTVAVGTFTHEDLFDGINSARELPCGACLGVAVRGDADWALLKTAADGQAWGITATYRTYSNGVNTGTLVQEVQNSNIVDILSDAGLAALGAGHTVNCPVERRSPQVGFAQHNWDEVEISIEVPIAGLSEVAIYAFSNNGPN